MNTEAVLLAGEFKPGSLGTSYERAFRQIGHAVHRFDVRVQRGALAWPARNRVLHRLAIHNFAARRAWSRQFNRDVVAAAARCDAPWVFVHNGEWLMPETVRALREQGRRVAIFHADNPFPPHYNNRPETLLAAREADVYLIWSERLVAKLRSEGVNAHFLAFGWDPEVFPYRGDIPQGTRKVVVFIGGWDREREAFLEQLAEHIPLEIYGPGYWGTRTRRNSRARACWQGRSLHGIEAAGVWRESAVSLNILRTQHYIDGQADGVIMRNFEVPGAGGFLLSTRAATAMRIFPEGNGAEYYADLKECVHKCQSYLDDESQRWAVAVEGRSRVLSGNTYLHRVQDVIRYMRTCPRFECSPFNSSAASVE